MLVLVCGTQSFRIDGSSADGTRDHRAGVNLASSTLPCRYRFPMLAQIAQVLVIYLANLGAFPLYPLPVRLLELFLLLL